MAAAILVDRMDVTLLLQPAVERSRSMLLYAQRLQANSPAETRIKLHQLPAIGSRISRQVPDLLSPPLCVPRIDAPLVHIIDHAHAGYLRFLKAPGIVTVHDLIPLKAIRGLYPTEAGKARDVVSARSQIWFQWNVFALPHARLLVAPSQATADDIRNLGLAGRCPIEVVPHGVDQEFFETPDATSVERMRERLGPLAQRPFLLQITNGFFYKNDAGFAEAFARLSQKFPDLGWVRVGAPPGPACGTLPEGRFLYYEQASLGELVSLYRQAAALLFTSWDEGFGWPPLEAMAGGCPVVASDRGALAETAAPAALVAAPESPEEMAEQTARILDSQDLREELRERGLAHARTYTWERAAQHMAEIYGSVYFSK